MKYLLIVAILLFPSISLAQDAEQPPTTPPQEEKIPYGQMRQMAKPLVCNNPAVVRNWIKDSLNFVPFVMGFAKNQMDAISSVLNMYVNPRNRDFIIIESAASGYSCILFKGADLFIYGTGEEEIFSMVPQEPNSDKNYPIIPPPAPPESDKPNEEKE
jgi:hypothetical protein